MVKLILHIFVSIIFAFIVYPAYSIPSKSAHENCTAQDMRDQFGPYVLVLIKTCGVLERLIMLPIDEFGIRNQYVWYEHKAIKWRYCAELASLQTVDQDRVDGCG